MNLIDPFSWSDPFLLGDQLTENERMIRGSGAAFALKKLVPRIEQAYLEEKNDPEIFQERGAASLLGVTVWPDRHFIPDAVRDYCMFVFPSRSGCRASVMGADGHYPRAECGHLML